MPCQVPQRSKVFPRSKCFVQNMAKKNSATLNKVDNLINQLFHSNARYETNITHLALFSSLSKMSVYHLQKNPEISVGL